MFSTLKILKIESVNKSLIAEDMSRYGRKLLPRVSHGYVLHSYQIPYLFYKIETSQDDVRSTYARTNTGYFNIECIGSIVWNALPLYIRGLQTLQLFKQQ